VIAVVSWIWPETVDTSPIVREYETRNLDYFIACIGQHCSYDMDRVFFEDLELPEPKYNLEVDCTTKWSGVHE